MGTSQICLGQSIPNNPIIVIDPGHGGSDSGAVGVNGTPEKSIVLRVAKKMVELHGQIYSESFELYLSRYSDTLISLRDRTRLANALKCDVLISIHCNQAPRSTAQGIEVYITEGKGKFERESLDLAMGLSQNLNRHLGFKNRGVKRANFQVLRETREVCPSILIELGFLSNKEEAGHAVKESSISAYALVILETLIKYFNERDNK